MLEVLARPTNNAEQFCDKEKDANFSAHTSQNFSPVCMKVLASMGSTSHFFVCFQCRRVNSIFTKCLNMKAMLKSAVKHKCRSLSKCR